MRRLDSPVNVHIDHVAAVLDIDYSPNGQEFVTGSFDRTIRIFPRDRAKSRSITLLFLLFFYKIIFVLLYPRKIFKKKKVLYIQINFFEHKYQ